MGAEVEPDTGTGEDTTAAGAAIGGEGEAGLTPPKALDPEEPREEDPGVTPPP